MFLLEAISFIQNSKPVMLSLLKNKFFLAYIFLFALSAWILWRNQYPLEDIFTGALMLGIFFPVIAYFLSRASQPLYADRPAQPAEPPILAGIMLYITVWLTWGTGWVNLHLPGFISNSEPAMYLFTIVKKLIAFVLIPCAVYHYRYGFSGKDFGWGYPLRQVITKRSLLILFGVGLPMFLFQYFLGGGAAPIREGKFSTMQMVLGFPLLFISLVVEVGLVEEFFFRALLQSRLEVLFKSATAGIIVSGLIFGMAHVPGFLLRGASSLEGLNDSAGWPAILAVAFVNLSIAGLFLGIIWHYTRNLWLVMAIHALVDLLPNLGEFVKTFGLN